MTNKVEYKKIDVFGEEGFHITSHNISHMDNKILLSGEDFSLIPHHKFVEAIGYSEDGYVQMNGIVTLSTTSQLNLDIVKLGDKKERRNFLKVKTRVKINLLRAYALGNSNRSLVINESRETRDISLGGVCFYSDKTFFKKQKLLIDFQHLKPNFITQAIVLRRDHEEQMGYRFRYACKFVNLNNEQQRVLCEYIFKVQIENHKRIRNED